MKTSTLSLGCMLLIASFSGSNNARPIKGKDVRPSQSPHEQCDADDLVITLQKTHISKETITISKRPGGTLDSPLVTDESQKRFEETHGNDENRFALEFKPQAPLQISQSSFENVTPSDANDWDITFKKTSFLGSSVTFLVKRLRNHDPPLNGEQFRNLKKRFEETYGSNATLNGGKIRCTGPNAAKLISGIVGHAHVIHEALKYYQNLVIYLSIPDIHDYDMFLTRSLATAGYKLQTPIRNFLPLSKIEAPSDAKDWLISLQKTSVWTESATFVIQRLRNHDPVLNDDQRSDFQLRFEEIYGISVKLKVSSCKIQSNGYMSIKLVSNIVGSKHPIIENLVFYQNFDIILSIPDVEDYDMFISRSLALARCTSPTPIQTFLPELKIEEAPSDANDWEILFKRTGFWSDSPEFVIKRLRNHDPRFRGSHCNVNDLEERFEEIYGHDVKMEGYFDEIRCNSNTAIQLISRIVGSNHSVIEDIVCLQKSSIKLSIPHFEDYKMFLSRFVEV